MLYDNIYDTSIYHTFWFLKIVYDIASFALGWGMI